MSDAAPAAVSGPALFARYAYPPNALGYCGPDDPAALLQAGSDAGGGAILHELASRFEGAWPYLQLIAACNGIADPLDRRVTEAYWVGSALLERVPAGLFVASLADRFGHRAGRLLDEVTAAVPLGGLAHHSFHVFAVYPWLGLLRGGMGGPPLRVLDRCRIRWGRVEEHLGDRVLVRSRRLRFDGWHLELGDAELEEVQVSRDGVGFVDDLAPGDLVSCHWDWVCDRLDDDSARRLRRYSSRNLAAVNAMPRPGPAVAADRHS